MAKFDWYKRNPAKFLAGTIGFTFEQKAGYGIVLDLIYDKEGRLADDSRWIAGILALSVRRWHGLRADLIRLEKIYLGADGCLHNPKADEAFGSRVDVAIMAERPIIASRSSEDKIAEKRPRSSKDNDLGQPLAQAGALARENQSQSQRENNNKSLVVAGMLRKIIEATGVDPTTDMQATIRWQRQLEDLLRAGLDIDLDVVPVMLEYKNKGRVPPGLGGPSYFRKMALEHQEARLTQSAIKAVGDTARAALSREDWIRGFEKFLDRGYWLGEFGAFPTEAKPDAPADILDRAQAAWDAQGQKPKNLDRVLWPHRAPVPFFGSNIVQLQARQA